MLAPIRTTRAYRLALRLVVGWLMLLIMGAGVIEYAVTSWNLRELPYGNVVAVVTSGMVTLWGWLHIIPMYGPFRPYRWVRWTALAMIGGAVAVWLF